VTVVPDRTYFIERVRDGEVVFREEVVTDMPCGEDIHPPDRMPPSFRAPARAFFDRNSRPRFTEVYIRGC
jgi:hypothetical protein